MKKISLAIIAGLISAPVLAQTTTPATAAPVTAPAATAPAVKAPEVKKAAVAVKPAAKPAVVAAPKPVEAPVVVAAAAPVVAPEAPKKSSNNFDGMRATLGGSYVMTFSDAAVLSPPKLALELSGVPSLPSGIDSVQSTLDNGMGKIALDFGYTKVIQNNILLGVSAFGGYDMYEAINKDSKFSFTKDGKVVANKDAENKLLNTAASAFGIVAGPDWFGGLKLSAGMVVTPNIAIKLIGEVSYARVKVTSKEQGDAYSSGWNFGGAVGAGVDFAATDRIIIGVGAKYKIPTDITLNKATDKDGTTTDITEMKFTTTGNTVELFAELGFRITQN
jgi:opacity protein-like surface antigen